MKIHTADEEISAPEKPNFKLISMIEIENRENRNVEMKYAINKDEKWSSIE